MMILLNANAQKHPYLFFTKDRLDKLKECIKKDTTIATAWQSIMVEANHLLVKGNAEAKIDYLSIAYLMT
ncbi:MAG TPA: hypothetical protein VIH57_20195, partial [Bacteroidales bacterium]